MSHHKHHEKHHDSDDDDDRREHHHDKHHHEKHHGGGEYRYEEDYEGRREGRHEGGSYSGPPPSGPYGYGGYGNHEGPYGQQQGYGPGPYGGGGPHPPPVMVHTTQVSEAQVKLDGIQAAHSHETTYQRTEYAGAAAAILGAGVAMYEGHQAKVDPQHAAMHKIGAEIAAGVGVAGAGVGIYGHHKKEQAEEQLNELESGGHKKKTSWF